MFIIYLSISKPFNSKPFIAFKKNSSRNNKYLLLSPSSWHAFITLFKMYVVEIQKQIIENQNEAPH